MSEKKQTEVVKVPEKVGFVVKAKEGFKKHKKAIIAGGLALGLGIFGLVKLMKKTGEELQEYLAFRRRGSKIPSKKGKGSYNRQDFKKGE